MGALKYLGILILLIGVGVLAATTAGDTRSNTMLLLGLALIIWRTSSSTRTVSASNEKRALEPCLFNVFRASSTIAVGDAFFCPQTPHDANLHPASSPKNARHRLRPDRDTPKRYAIGFSRPQATLKNECEANVMDFQPDVLFIDTISKSVSKAFIFLTGSPMYFIPISFY